MNLEPRLRSRYEKLVAAHSNCTQKLAAGVKSLADGTTAFAQTQALWRYLSNPRVTPLELSRPLLAVAHEEVSHSEDHHVLCVHDWSRLNYNSHGSKRDRVQMTHAADVGYELQSSLLVSASSGVPLVAPVQNLVTGAGVWQSRAETLKRHEQTHLDELTERMEWLEGQRFDKALVHLIDREGDSIAHLRQWSAQGWRWLVRVKEGSRMQHHGIVFKAGALAEQLHFERERSVTHQGQAAVQWLANTEVIITRNAKPKREESPGKRRAIAGEPLAARLIVSRIYNAAGELVSQWYLLTNVEEGVPPAEIAQWYHHRWQIESYFKLLKEAGHQLESWEQETGEGILKRLLIAGQASVLAWRLMRAEDEQATHTRAFLVRLSGRQMKRTRPVTAPALLDGLFKLFTMLETLKNYSLSELEAFAEFAFPRQFSTGAKDV